jgi:diguanylate cyclase (GGDEF)-like protein
VSRRENTIGRKLVIQGVVPLVIVSCSLAYVARVFTFETLGPTWGGACLVLLFAAIAAKALFFIMRKRRLEDDLFMGLLVVLAVKALAQTLSWGVCANTSGACPASFQGLEFLAFAFLALYHPTGWLVAFAVFAGLLELGYVAGPAVLHAAAEPEVVRAGLPGVLARLAYDLAFGVPFGLFVRHERATRDYYNQRFNRLEEEAKSFRLSDVVATPQAGQAGLEAMSRAGREEAEMRAVTRLREKEQQIAVFLKQSLMCYSAAIFRFDAGSGTLELRAMHSDCNEKEKNWDARVKPGEGMVGWVYYKREKLPAGNTGTPLAGLPYYHADEQGIQSFIGYPIVDPESDRALGVLCVDSREMNALKEQHYSTLDMAARMLVEAVRAEESRARQEHEALQLQAMLELSRQITEGLDVSEICRRVVHSMFRIVPYEVAAVTLWDADKNTFRVEYAARAGEAPGEATEWLGEEFGPDTESAVVLAMRGDAPMLIANYRDRDKSKRIPLWSPAVKTPDIDSVLAVPLKRGGEPVGAVVLGARGRDVFEETERKLFGILASLIATSLLNAQKHRATEERASTDALTGLANRQKFREFFQQQSALAKRSKQPLSLLIMDLDHFKKVNDTYGHPAGDAVLKQMAAILKAQSRETDLPSRYGGEEFVAVLVNTTRKDATRMAERIRKAVAGHAFEIPDGRTIKCTVSIGGATLPDDTSKEDQLTERADKALYGAKSGGRNRVQQYCDLPDREGTTSWSGRDGAPGAKSEKTPPGGGKDGGGDPGDNSWRFGS